MADTGLVLGRALDRGQVVLLEGAQATMLDVDHGTYPFVTSSSPTAGGACAGSGIGPTRISEVIGIVKAYTTRVGEGPFPTELRDEQGEWLRKTGAEYGVTTGRPRRTGWFDAVIARYATRVNGITGYFLTKLDVLSGLDQVPVCVAYEVDGQRYDEIPMTQTEFHHAVPVYEYFDGWWEDISKARTFDDLPPHARAYVAAVEQMIGAPICGGRRGPAPRPDPPAPRPAACEYALDRGEAVKLPWGRRTAPAPGPSPDPCRRSCQLGERSRLYAFRGDGARCRTFPARPARVGRLGSDRRRFPHGVHGSRAAV